MRIRIVTPAPAGSQKGNRITAVRWGTILRDLGHQVAISQDVHTSPDDLLIALHAGKSAAAVQAFRSAQPGKPVLVALTGTDVYDAIRSDPAAQETLQAADRLLVLQPLAIQELPDSLQHKARVLYQSFSCPPSKRSPSSRFFDVCILGHLRPVKDPFRTAWAARLLPQDSRIRILHLGAALDQQMAQQAHQEQRENPRYRWLGETPRAKALRILGASHLLSLTSFLEGGANVLSEAVVLDVPVVCSRIPGNRGLLGEDYPGFFTPGNTQELAQLLRRAETEPTFLLHLQQHCRQIRSLFDPAAERQRWRELLAELGLA